MGMGAQGVRWATLDCYGTLVDWNAGIRGELARLFGEEEADRLLARYHEVEPRIQTESPGASYREVMGATLSELADEAGMQLPEDLEVAVGRRVVAIGSAKWRAMLADHHGLSTLGAEAVATVLTLQAHLLVSARDDASGIRRCCRTLRLRHETLPR